MKHIRLFKIKDKKTYIYYLLLLLTGIFILVNACREKKDMKDQLKQELSKDENLVKINKYLVKKDAEIIESYIKRGKLDMKETETGLWYMIYEKGTGIQAQPNHKATISYSISLLDGTFCYASDSANPKQFRIGQGGVESGLEQGILLMHVGDKAQFIMPPHLAHGLLGDEDKIPPRSIIIYDVELISLE